MKNDPISAAEQLIDRIAAAAEAEEYPLIGELAAKLPPALIEAPESAQNLRNLVVRLQQILSGVRSKKLRLQREFQALECCRNYLAPPGPRDANKVSVTA